MLPILATALALFVLSSVFSAVETSVLMLSAGRIHRLAETDRPGSRGLERLAAERHRMRAARELLAALAYVGAGGAGLGIGVYIENIGAGILLGIVLVLVAYSVTQALPRTLAVTNPERIALEFSTFGVVLTSALYPVARVLSAPWKWGVSLTGAERPFSLWAVTPEWRGNGDSDEESERDEAEEAFLEAVSDFAEKIVREVMVPRTDMQAIEDTATIPEAVALIESSGVTRVPVYHETLDDVRGVLYAKDLLVALASGAQVTPLLLAREPYFVPETKPVEELLREMRTRTHIAIVADEYGGTAGLVTLEDLLEEIVGDISDEYDVEERLLEDLGEGRYRMDARLPVDDLNELFGTDLETEADSVGGLFTEVAGHIPESGESVEFEGVRLTVTDLEGTRIRQLNVESVGTTGQGETDA